jgi:hypothetical protein
MKDINCYLPSFFGGEECADDEPSVESKYASDENVVNTEPVAAANEMPDLSDDVKEIKENTK